MADGPPLTLACFLDRPGWAARSVWLDCQPETFTKLELARDPTAGMIRRTWRLVGLDRLGVAVYLEQPPAPFFWQSTPIGKPGRVSKRRREILERMWDLDEPEGEQT